MYENSKTLLVKIINMHDPILKSNRPLIVYWETRLTKKLTMSAWQHGLSISYGQMDHVTRG